MTKPIYVHSDLFAYLSAFPKLMVGCSGPQEAAVKAFDAMLKDLQKIAQGPIIVPTYNYDFNKTGVFDVRSDPSRVGQFTELFRKKYSASRTLLPLYSNCCDLTGYLPQTLGERVDPFDVGSDFELLVKEQGEIVIFGSDFMSTFIIYIERQFPGGPMYRYDKYFDGQVIGHDGNAVKTQLKLHVRPLQAVVVYDLKRIQADLCEAGLMTCHLLGEKFNYAKVDAAGFLEFVLGRAKTDPMYLLTQETKDYFKETRAFKRGRVLLEDFEKEE